MICRKQMNAESGSRKLALVSLLWASWLRVTQSTVLYLAYRTKHLPILSWSWTSISAFKGCIVKRDNVCSKVGNRDKHGHRHPHTPGFALEPSCRIANHPSRTTTYLKWYIFGTNLPRDSSPILELCVVGFF